MPLGAEGLTTRFEYGVAGLLINIDCPKYATDVTFTYDSARRVIALFSDHANRLSLPHSRCHRLGSLIGGWVSNGTTGVRVKTLRQEAANQPNQLPPTASLL